MNPIVERGKWIQRGDGILMSWFSFLVSLSPVHLFSTDWNITQIPTENAPCYVLWDIPTPIRLLFYGQCNRLGRGWSYWGWQDWGGTVRVCMADVGWRAHLFSWDRKKSAGAEYCQNCQEAWKSKRRGWSELSAKPLVRMLLGDCKKMTLSFTSVSAPAQDVGGETRLRSNHLG